SIILIEDVDAAFIQRQPGEQANHITFSGLLNAIDGVAAQAGRVIILTTNHPERLDPALVRPGRIDLEHELTTCDADMLERFFRRFFPDAEAWRVALFAEMNAGADLAPSVVQQFLLQHDGDRDAATCGPISTINSIGDQVGQLLRKGE
ncbi:MAG: AAA family ATPase, partial [Candidatus Kapaibacterium sp.]